MQLGFGARPVDRQKVLDDGNSAYSVPRNRSLKKTDCSSRLALEIRKKQWKGQW